MNSISGTSQPQPIDYKQDKQILAVDQIIHSLKNTRGLSETTIQMIASRILVDWPHLDTTNLLDPNSIAIIVKPDNSQIPNLYNLRVQYRYADPSLSLKTYEIFFSYIKPSTVPSYLA